MPSSCEFILNRINGVYFSGETIEGAIVLTTTSPKVVDDVTITFKGEGKVKWKKNNSDHAKEFRSSELYVDNTCCVHGEGTLEPGSHSYAFVIALPVDCRTSLEGRYGHIRYELTLKVNRPNRFDNIFSKPITVIKTMDLNLIPSYQLPLLYEEFTSPLCCSWSTDQVIYTFRVPAGGFTSGQALKYSLHIHNKTMSDVDGYTIEFYKNMSFIAKSPYRNTRSKTYSLYKERFNKPCLRLTSRQFEGEYLIPATPPSSNKNDIIVVEYFLKAVVHLTSCETAPDIVLPIVIGTVPLRQSFVPSAVAESTGLIEATEELRERFEQMDFQPTAPDFSFHHVGNDLPPNYRELGPPTFEEALRCNSPFVDTDKDERHRNIGFQPLYPMYSQTY